MRLLERCGSEVRSSTSAAQALEIIERWQPNLLISDIGMPHEDGYALIRKVRALPAERGGQIPAVALTAYAGAEDRKRALEAGYQMHLPKPVDPAELTTAVAGFSA